MNQTNAVSALAAIRTAIGVASWTTPRLAGRLFGLDARANPQLPYLARLFGVRDVALAWGVIASDGETRRQWLLVGVACDTADALAGVAGGRGGYLSKFTGALVSGTAIVAAALGVVALGDE